MICEVGGDNSVDLDLKEEELRAGPRVKAGIEASQATLFSNPEAPKRLVLRLYVVVPFPNSLFGGFEGWIP